jgi:hypothetical protein
VPDPLLVVELEGFTTKLNCLLTLSDPEVSVIVTVYVPAPDRISGILAAAGVPTISIDVVHEGVTLETLLEQVEAETI